MKRTIIVISVLLALVACEQEMSPDYFKESGNQLLVESLPVLSSDSTAIRVVPTKSLKKGAAVVPLSDVDVQCEVNGKPMDIFPAEQENVYYYRHQFVSGDKISLRVSARDYETVRGENEMPEPVKVETEFVPDSDGLDRLRVKLSRNEEEISYAVRISERILYETVTWRRGYREYSIVTKDWSELYRDDYELQGADNTDVPGFRPFGSAMVNGKEYFVVGARRQAVINTIVCRHENRYNGITYHEKGDTTVQKYQYLVEAYALDHDTYNYLNPEVNYYMLALGLLPPFASPTNLEGGYGVLGVMSGYSEWKDEDPDSEIQIKPE